MARKFWERVGGNLIRFYREPEEVKADEATIHIQELQDILAAPDSVKMLLAESMPAVQTEEEFEGLFTGELEELADRLDYWDYEQETETITVVSKGWWSPADAKLGAATIVSASSEVQPAIGAIDKNGSTPWETETNPAGPHDLRFTWGYAKRIRGIRFRVGPAVENAEALEGVSIWLANQPGGLENDANKFLDNQDIAVVGTHADPWLEIEDFGSVKADARYCRIEITGTGAGNNRAVIRDIELRALVRTFGI